MNGFFARQRYWGEPIPVVFVDDKIETLPESDLPLVLPELEDYSPSKTGASPLDKATNWVNTTFDGKPAKKERLVQCLVLLVQAGIS